MVNDTQQIPAGYKQTDVGVIPEDWELGHLGAESDLVTKGTTPTSMGKNFTSSGINFVKVESLDENGCFDKSLFAHIDQSTHTLLRRSQLKENDLLISIAGALGRAGIVKSDILPANTNQALSLVRLSKDSSITLSFLYYFVKTPVIKKYIDDVSVQGAQPNLSLKNISDLPIYYPSDIHEQEKIVEILLDIDSLISKLDQLIQKKKNIKHGAMQELLTGKRRLPGFSGEWVDTTLGNVVDIRKGQLITSNTIKHGNVPVIAGGKTPAYFHNKANRLGKTITVSASGASAGYVWIHLSAIFASDCSTIEESSNYSIGFIYYWLKLMQEEIYYLQTGGAQPHIHPSDLNPMPILIPSIEEQIAIEQVLSDMDAEIDNLVDKKLKYQNLKQGMMQQLLTGKIRLIKPGSESKESEI